MNRINLFRISMIGVLAVFTACTQHASGGAEDATEIVMDRDVPQELNKQMEQLTSSYFELKDLLVADDSAAAADKATELLAKVNEVNSDLVPAVDAKRWLNRKKELIKSGLGVQQAPTLEDQRKHFEALGNTLYLVLTEIGAGSTKVYRQYCPMAFENTGAYWLSDKAEIRNPYFGDMMLECGLVKEVISFKPKQ